jgi:hypothetical protein
VTTAKAAAIRRVNSELAVALAATGPDSRPWFPRIVPAPRSEYVELKAEPTPAVRQHRKRVDCHRRRHHEPHRTAASSRRK